MAKRRFTPLLPYIHQTETLKKFFGATVDHLFQPGKPENLSGYIGQKPSYYNEERDFYIAEPTAQRRAYQLEPAMLSRAEDRSISHLFFYDDLISSLKANNGNVSNHNRLFSDEVYGWTPPLDPDKLINFRQYSWFGDNPHLIPALQLSIEFETAWADGTVSSFRLPPSRGYPEEMESPIVFVDGMSVEFERNADGIFLDLTEVPPQGAEIIVYRYGDMSKLIVGQTEFDLSSFNTEGVTKATSGMRITLNDGLARYLGWDKSPLDTCLRKNDRGRWEVPAFSTRGWDTSAIAIPFDQGEATRSYFIEGVGREITLVQFRSEPVTGDPVHVVMDRAARNDNPWSRINYWVHRDAYRWADLSFPERAAQRPIIEFVHNLELSRYGRARIGTINATITGDPRELKTVLDRSDTIDEVSDWSVLYFDEQPYESSGLRPFPLADVNGRELGTVYVDAGRMLRFGDRLLVRENANVALNHRILTVRRALSLKDDPIRTGDWDIQRYDTAQMGTIIVNPNPSTKAVMILEVSDAPRIGDMVRMAERGMIPFDVTPNDSLSWEFSREPVEYYYDGEGWQEAQSRGLRGNDPLFALYRADGVAHEDIIGSTFSGNRIFGFAEMDAGVADPILNRAIRYDSHNQIVFENDLETRRTLVNGEPLPAHPFFNFLGIAPEDDLLTNGWSAAGQTSNQTLTDGFYSVPVNLRANADNEAVTFVARNQFFDHFASIIGNQDNLVGSPFRNNSWRDTARSFAGGAKIIQNRSPLIKAMLLNADSRFDYMDAVRFVDEEYSRFRNKFVQQINTVLTNGQRRAEDDATMWVETILQNLRFAKTNEFAFALSNVGGGQFFIPATAASLGLLNPSRPEIITDTTYPGEPVTLVRGHDGSQTPSLGALSDRILLALENLIYDNIPEKFTTEAGVEFDMFRIIGGRHRLSGPNSLYYDRAEVAQILSPMMLRFAKVNGYDYRVNNGYAADNAFTWNYRDLPDRDGKPLAGHWRGIYRYYFDTDRPHTAPWEMLGFASRPDWWTAEYGPAPYLRGNTKLWEDMRDGRILRGPRAGVDARFTRPDLFDVLPVADDGSLLDPIAANIVPDAPNYVEATRAWKVGDHGPVENLWLNSTSYRFALAQAAYLMRPAEWVETGWDTLARTSLKDGQWVHIPNADRPRSADLYVHGEIGPDDALVRVTGLQQWIVDHMISKAQDPVILGSAVRGLAVQLAHKMAGFTQEENLRVFADNFGLVPNEDTEIALHRSPPIKDSTYSGLLIEWTGDGWMIVGYDSQEEFFHVIPGEETGTKQTIALDELPAIYEWRSAVYYPKDRLAEYEGTVYRALESHTSSGKFEGSFWNPEPSLSTNAIPRVVVRRDSTDETIRVPYYTTFRTYDEIVEFIASYGRWLESEGWVFDGTDESGEIQDWNAAIREFLKWAQMDWAPGNFLVLSPGASTLKYVTNHGFVLNMEETANGIYGLIDRTGRPIPRRDTFVSRLDEETKIITTTDDLFGARVRVAEEEHVVVFANRTKFADVVYDPLFDLRQPRLRLTGMRSQPWAGRHDAPGYVIRDKSLLPSFEKATQDIRNAFDIENSDSRVLRDYAHHLTGFEPRSYLNNLLLSETSQFEFYQGMIQQKGAPGVFDKLGRSRFIDQDRDLGFVEEWAFHVGRYGSPDNQRTVSFYLNTPDIRASQQLIQFGKDDSTDAIVGIPGNSDRWIERPVDPTNVFATTKNASSRLKLPTGGYVRNTEVSYIAFNTGLLNRLADTVRNNGGSLAPRDRIWLMEDDAGSFGVHTLHEVSTETNPVALIETSLEDPTLFYALRITFMDTHGLSEDDVGKFVVFPYGSTDSDGVRGFHRIEKVEDEFSFQIGSTLPKGMDFSENGGSDAPAVWILRERRFPDMVALHDFHARYPIFDGERVYVDDGGAGRWVVCEFDTFDGFKVVREQPDKIDNERLGEAVIYADRTDVSKNQITAAPVLLDHIAIIDPVAGLIPGNAENELSWVVPIDPAVYEPSSEARWGNEQLGKLWWDISTVRFTEAETDRLDHDNEERAIEEMNYRIANWGKTVAGSDMHVYEWTRSTTAPSDVGNFLAEREFDQRTGTMIDVYYFWILNPARVPSTNRARKISARQVAQTLLNPKSNDLPWMAAIAPDSMLISGVEQFLNERTSVLQFAQTRDNHEGVVHNEWQIVRKGDDRSLPPDNIWAAMRASLAGLGTNNEVVPATSLPERHRIGLGTNQSVFTSTLADPRGGMLAGRRSFVEAVNAIFARSDRAHRNANAVSLLAGDSPIYPLLAQTATNADARLIQPPRGSYTDEVFSLSDRDELLDTRPYLLARGFYPFAEQTLGFDEQPFEQAQSPLPNDLRILVRNEDSLRPSWSVWEINPASAPHATGNALLRPSKGFDHTVPNHVELERLITRGVISLGQRALVTNDETLSGFWAVWRYDGERFVLENSQTYRLGDFVQRVDWFAEGYSPRNPPVNHYADETSRNLGELANPRNVFVQIDNDGQGRWAWTAWNGQAWVVVARQAGTFALSSAFYDATRTLFLGNSTDQNAIINRDGSLEMQALIDLLPEVMTVAERNELFFSLLHFVHTQHDQVDWAFKTSFLSVMGLNERLAQTPLQTYDLTDNLLTYIDEVKPYRVKTRDYSQSMATDIDQANVHATDFDKPVYFDARTNSYRRLDPNAAADLAIIREQSPWKDWYDAGFNSSAPVRKIKTTMRFDRVDPGVFPLWRSNGFDLFGFDDEAFDRPIGRTDSSSALARMLDYYLPGSGMVEKDAATLFGLGFKGLSIDGGDFFVPVAGDPTDWSVRGFDMQPLESILLTSRDQDITGISSDDDVITVDYNPNGREYDLTDPFHQASRPQELANARPGDGLLISTTARHGIGRPAVVMASANVARHRRPTVTLTMSGMPYENGAVSVFRDGIRLPDTEYSIDLFARKVTVNLIANPRSRSVCVVGLGTGGMTNIVGEYFFVAQESNAYSLPINMTGLFVDVIVNGEELADSDFTVQQNVVTTIDLPADADVRITARRRASDFDIGGFDLGIHEANGPDDLDTRTRMRTQEFALVPSQRWTLAEPPIGLSPPHSGVIVEVNGKRLTPPRTVYDRFGAIGTSIPFFPVFDASSLRVWVNGAPFEADVAKLNPWDIPTPGQYDMIIVNDRLTVLSERLANSNVAISLYEKHDYEIDGDDLVITRPLGKSSFDIEGWDNFGIDETLDEEYKIVVTTISNPGRTDLRTYVFPASANGSYSVPPFNEPDSPVMVWVGGLLKTPYADYELATERTEESSATTLTFRNGHSPLEQVVMTVFDGREATLAGRWAMASRSHGLSMLGDPVLGGDFDEADFDVQGLDTFAQKTEISPQGRRPAWRMNESYDWIDWSPERAGALSQPLMLNDTEIRILKNPKGMSPKIYETEPFQMPDLTAGTPGVIFINGERIEYFTMRHEGNVAVLGQLRRATRGTRIGKEQRVVSVEAASGVQMDFRLVGATLNLPIEVSLRDGEIQIEQVFGRDYTLRQEGNDVVASFFDAPAQGLTSVLAQTSVPLHEQGSPVHTGEPSDLIAQKYIHKLVA